MHYEEKEKMKFKIVWSYPSNTGEERRSARVTVVRKMTRSL